MTKREVHTLQMSFKVSPTLKRGVRRCAKATGMGDAEWIRAVLARAIHEGAFLPAAKRKGE